MSNNVFGIIFASVVLVGFAGLWLYSKWLDKKRRERWPKTWVHLGKIPPSGIEEALAIIVKELPGLPNAGTIEWTDGPFELFAGQGLMVAGTVLNTSPVYVKITFNPFIERTALAHELVHAWSDITKQDLGESYPMDRLTGKPDHRTDLRFVQKFTDINAKIRVALGR